MVRRKDAFDPNQKLIVRSKAKRREKLILILTQHETENDLKN